MRTFTDKSLDLVRTLSTFKPRFLCTRNLCLLFCLQASLLCGSQRKSVSHGAAAGGWMRSLKWRLWFIQWIVLWKMSAVTQAVLLVFPRMCTTYPMTAKQQTWADVVQLLNAVFHLSLFMVMFNLWFIAMEIYLSLRNTCVSNHLECVNGLVIFCAGLKHKKCI